MSEHEKLKRTLYKKNRKKWISILAVALALAVAFCAISFQVYRSLNQTYYIRYTEHGDVDYTVSLKENSFYDEESLDGGRAYISSLIDGITADFTYQLAMQTQNVSFDYSYRIDSQLLVVDDNSEQVLFDPVYQLLPEKASTVASGETLSITEQVGIDFQQYNSLAGEFIEVYQLKDATCTLAVTLYVDVISSCQSFTENENNSYFITLNIPLAQNTLSMETASSTGEESKVIACSNGIGSYLFKIVSIVMAVLSLLLAAGLVLFIYHSRNDDINYTIRKNRILSSYRSYIQQIQNEFDTSGYQLLEVKTFPELLGIRDTLQSPVLMYENDDQTRCLFFIPTNTKLLYVYEIKVDNYDKLYGICSTGAASGN